MHFTENIETLRVNISDIDALKIRERELERGAQKVNISRIHSGLIEIEIHRRYCINVTPKRLN
jgi:phosphopantetheine adenylyltransferase